MSKEFNLSEREHYIKDGKLDDKSKHFPILYGADVKEFIKQLKERVRHQEKNRNMSLYYIQEEIDKLAGEDLIKY